MSAPPGSQHHDGYPGAQTFPIVHLPNFAEVQPHDLPHRHEVQSSQHFPNSIRSSDGENERGHFSTLADEAALAPSDECNVSQAVVHTAAIISPVSCDELLRVEVRGGVILRFVLLHLLCH